MHLRQPIRIVIADDHVIFLGGLKATIEKFPDLVVVGEAINGEELVTLVERNVPDVILTDIVMPVMDGIEATRKIYQKYPQTGIIALSMYDQDHYILAMLEAGAIGYLLKNASQLEIAEAIHAAYHHKDYYSQSISRKISLMISKTRNKLFNTLDQELVLTEKEIAIIRMICEEKTNEEMGQLLYLSPRTIEGYKLRIYEKLEVKSVAGIAIYAIKSGIYKIE